jgi:hypothetical protein
MVEKDLLYSIINFLKVNYFEKNFDNLVFMVLKLYLPHFERLVIVIIILYSNYLMNFN